MVAYRKISHDELDVILDNHRKWLKGEKGGERADLQDANLQGADLRYAYLQDADLQDADLRYADLQRAYLRYANLQGADLRHANLRYAYLQDADLRYADLQDADLQRADLRYAYLQRASLQRADLQDADLLGANLYEAYVGESTTTILSIAQTVICPEEGSFIAFKKALYEDAIGRTHECIVKLEIPADANRSNATGRKCRSSKARVVRIEDIEGNVIDGSCHVFSMHDRGFSYSNGAMVVPTEPFDDDRWIECAPGIHFYITRREAVEH